MPKLNVQQNNANVIKALRNALAIGQIKGPIASDGADNFSSAGGNRNLLDNSFFTIRQRGNGPFTGNVYGIDRWRGGNSRSTITGASGYITLATNTSGNGILRQILPQTYEGTYTFSAVVGGSGSGALFLQDSGGTIIGNAVEFTTTGDTQLVTLTFTTSGTAIGGVAVRVDVSNTIEVVCAKLEKGTVSTLANDTPPDYATELAKCQRYFVRVLGDPFGTGYITTAGNNSRINVPVAMTMRATPTVSFSGTFHLRVQGNTLNVTTMSTVSPKNTAGGITLSCSGFSGATTGPCALYADGTSDYIDFSADL